jgi:uncharacterized protein YdaU (DUF1376 family)
VDWYKHYLTDYDGDTAHLSWDEDMAYMRLLRAYYRLERPLPKDPATVYRLCRATTRTQKEAVSRVLHEFFHELDDGWHNRRANKEIAAYRTQCAINQRVGRLGGRPKKTESVSGNNRNGSDTVSEKNPNQIPDKTLAAGAALDPVWGAGLDVLLTAAVPENHARAFIGALLGSWEAKHVLEALQASSGKADPRAYARGYLKGRPKKGEGQVLKVAMP